MSPRKRKEFSLPYNIEDSLLNVTTRSLIRKVSKDLASEASLTKTMIEPKVTKTGRKLQSKNALRSSMENSNLSPKTLIRQVGNEKALRRSSVLDINKYMVMRGKDSPTSHLNATSTCESSEDNIGEDRSLQEVLQDRPQDVIKMPFDRLRKFNNQKLFKFSFATNKQKKVTPVVEENRESSFATDENDSSASSCASTKVVSDREIGTSSKIASLPISNDISDNERSTVTLQRASTVNINHPSSKPNDLKDCDIDVSSFFEEPTNEVFLRKSPVLTSSGVHSTPGRSKASPLEKQNSGRTVRTSGHSLQRTFSNSGNDVSDRIASVNKSNFGLSRTYSRSAEKSASRKSSHVRTPRSNTKFHSQHLASSRDSTRRGSLAREPREDLSSSTDSSIDSSPIKFSRYGSVDKGRILYRRRSQKSLYKNNGFVSTLDGENALSAPSVSPSRYSSTPSRGSRRGQTKSSTSISQTAAHQNNFSENTERRAAADSENEAQSSESSKTDLAQPNKLSKTPKKTPAKEMAVRESFSTVSSDPSRNTGSRVVSSTSATARSRKSKADVSVRGTKKSSATRGSSSSVAFDISGIQSLDESEHSDMNATNTNKSVRLRRTNASSQGNTLDLLSPTLTPWTSNSSGSKKNKMESTAIPDMNMTIRSVLGKESVQASSIAESSSKGGERNSAASGVQQILSDSAHKQRGNGNSIRRSSLRKASRRSDEIMKETTETSSRQDSRAVNKEMPLAAFKHFLEEEPNESFHSLSSGDEGDLTVNRSSKRPIVELTGNDETAAGTSARHSADGAPLPRRRKEKTSRIPKVSTHHTQKLLELFADMPFSHTGIKVAEECAEIFWEKTFGALEDYAKHAGRNNIEARDIELLLFRQGWARCRQDFNALYEEYLPLELRSELIPIATADNVVRP